MSIDRNTVPEGATHVVADIYNLRESQVKINTGNPYRKYVDGDWYAFVEGSWVYVLDAEPSRYQLIPAPWTGEGLPPVGTVCDMTLRQGTNTEVEVLAYHGQSVWLKDTGKHSGVHYFTSEIDKTRIQFRPIRTPEQIAAEERESAINDMLTSTNCRGKPWAEKFGELYDAGYRKQVAP